MTIPVLFLLGGLSLAVVLGLIVWLFSRPRKPKFGSTIDTFSSDLSALAPSEMSGRRRSDLSRPPGPRAAAASTQRQAANGRPKPGPAPRS